MYNTQRSNRTHIFWYTILILSIIGLLWWGIAMNIRHKTVTTKLANQYNRAFFELVDYVDDISTSLDKTLLVNSPSQMASLSSDLFRKSSAAKAALGQLPISDIEMDNTAKFLSQVGDYTYVLSQNMINNEKITDDEYKSLESLGTFAKSMNNSLMGMQNEIYEGKINFNNIASKSKQVISNVAEAANGANTGMEGVEKEFQEYPSLIYDGPFSEHMENMEPVMLKDSPEISQDDALKKAKQFLGERGNKLVFESETQNTNMPAYTFTGGDDNGICISISKKGGYVIYFLDNRNVENGDMSFEEAINIAAEYIDVRGFKSMKNSYYDKSAGIATINFAYQQDNITCYSDLVKVRVALDNGEVLGIEANGYLMNHHKRDVAAAKLTTAEARQKINSKVTIEKVNMAIIPKDSLKEVYCYELQGKLNDKNCIVYVNADNGREEKVLMLLESADGILTM